MTHWTSHIRKLALLLVAALALMAVPALAQEGVPEKAPEHGATRTSGEVSQLTQQISQEIYSPFCPGKTLAMCPSPGAAEVRRDIQDLARQGMQKQDIKETIVGEYGEEFRMVEPPASDNYALLGVLAGAFALCLIAIWFFAGRKKTGPAEDAADAGPPPEDLSAEDQEYLERVRADYQD